MRDILDLLQQINEAVGMSAGEILKYEDRFNKFIHYIQSRTPFTTVDGGEVIIDPREAKRFVDLRNQDMFKGTLKARTTDGQEIPLSKLAKTLDFGGAAAAAGQDASQAGKEALIVKPSQIGICDQEFPAEDFYKVIISNKELSNTDYGKVIQQLAEYITAGEYVMLPEEYQGKEKEKVRKAIVDYAGEYLGVLALLYNRSRFPRKKQFEEWLGAGIDEITLNFPSKANNNVADSYATITNKNTSQTLNISSKGTGGGAAPAISGLIVPDYIRKNPAFKNAVTLIDICQKQSTLQQAFSVMDLVYEANPKSIDKRWHKWLPFSKKHPNLPELCKQSIASGNKVTKIGLPKEYEPLWANVSGGGTEGGKVVYDIRKEVAEAINSREGIPEFRGAVLQILEMNFIQQYCDYKGGELTFATQWPAKLDGKVSMVNKCSTVSPNDNGFSFKLGREDESVSSEPGEPEVDGAPTFAAGDDLETAAQDITNPRMSRNKKEEPTNLGREKRAKF